MVGDHFLYFCDLVFDSGVILQGGKLDTSHSLGLKLSISNN